MYSNRKEQLHILVAACHYFPGIKGSYWEAHQICLFSRSDRKNALGGRRPPDLAHLVDLLDTKMLHVLAVLWRGHKFYHFCDSGPSKILHMEVVIYNCEDSIPGAVVFKRILVVS